MLDCLSGGRLIAGFPLGTAMDTIFGYGQVPITLREKYQEAHDLVVKAWTEREPFSFNGKYNQQRYVNIWPRPYQQPRPPIWVPGSGSLETWDWTIKNDYVYCYLSYSGYKVGKTVLDGFWDEMDRQGKEFNPYHAGFLQLVAVSETDAQGRGVQGFHRVLLQKSPCTYTPGLATRRATARSAATTRRCPTPPPSRGRTSSRSSPGPTTWRRAM